MDRETSRKGNPPKSGQAKAAGARVAKARRSAAGKISDVLLSHREAEAMNWILNETGESKAGLVRRLIVDEAYRLEAPLTEGPQ